MSAWGVGIYDNDAASDWLSGLDDGGLAAVSDAFLDVPSTGFIDAEVAQQALAAADVVGRLQTGRGASSSHDESLATWVRGHDVLDASALVASARRAISRIVDQQDSELFELWADGDDLAGWLTTLNELIDRLG